MSEATVRDWKKTLLKYDALISDAISCLNDSMMQIVLVVDEANRLKGTITDGDVRRGLLAGVELRSSLKSIINQEPLVVSPTMTRETVFQLMQVNQVRQLPVVDDERCVVGLHLWDALLVPASRNNIMIIMAGGKGTRLRPQTESCPKPLLAVAGKPMLEHIIERAKGEGFHHFVLAIHYLGHMIEDYFGDGSRWNVTIEYLREESPLGTAGALSLLPHATELPILITNGDVLTDIHYGDIVDFHNSHDAQATMAVRQDQFEYPFGVVETDGVDIVGFDEKPVMTSQINAGIYVLNPDTLRQLEENEFCDMPTLFSILKDRALRTIAYPMYEPWLDVGRHDDLDLARKNHPEN